MDTAKFRRDLLEVQSELQRFAYKLTADKEEANDLLQETSLKALGNMDKYTPDTNFKGWVYTIMRNIFINNYRKEVRDQTFVDHTDNLFHINQPREFENYTTENNYDSKEIYRVVHSLPRDYRIPFLMHISGFKYREIAERLELPLGTGDVDFDVYLPALAATGFDGFLTIEREVGETPEKDIRHAVEFLKAKMAKYNL